MWTPLDLWQRLSGRRSARLAAMLLVLLFGAVAIAAAAPQSNGSADLRRTIESRYEVLPVSGGILLKPRQAQAGIRAIEVTRQGVAVNGFTFGAAADSVTTLQRFLFAHAAVNCGMLWNGTGAIQTLPPS